MYVANININRNEFVVIFNMESDICIILAIVCSSWFVIYLRLFLDFSFLAEYHYVFSEPTPMQIVPTRNEELLFKLFNCTGNKNFHVPIFPRHGLMLGAVREHAMIRFSDRIDDDADIGFIHKNGEEIYNFFVNSTAHFWKNSSYLDDNFQNITDVNYNITEASLSSGMKECLSTNNIKVYLDDDKYSTKTWKSNRGLKTCEIPPESFVKGIMSAPREKIREYCEHKSRINNFSAWLQDARYSNSKILLSLASVFQHPQFDDSYGYSFRRNKRSAVNNRRSAIASIHFSTYTMSERQSGQFCNGKQKTNTSKNKIVLKIG